MKRKLISLALCLLLLPVLLVQAKTALVLDYAGLMDRQQTADLMDRASRFKESHGLDVAILTIGTTTGSPSVEAFADDFLERNYHMDGVLFLVDMGSRSWHISTSGAAREMLSDEDLIALEEAVIPSFSAGQFYKGFDAYLNKLPGLLDDESSLLTRLLICGGAGAVIAGIILAIMTGAMNTKRRQHSAADYTVKGSWQLRTHQDFFLYSHVTKRAKPRENKSGSTTHTSSSGRTHGGRGGKF